MQRALEDGDCRGRSTAIAHNLFEPQSRFKILRARQAVRYDCGFKRDDGATFRNRGFYFRTEFEDVVQVIFGPSVVWTSRLFSRSRQVSSLPSLSPPDRQLSPPRFLSRR